MGLPVVANSTVGCVYGGDGQALRVLHPNAYGSRVTPGADQTFFQGERSDTGEEAAAVLAVGGLGAVGPHLQEQVVHVRVVACRRADGGDLGGERMSTTQPVDLAGVG